MIGRKFRKQICYRNCQRPGESHYDQKFDLWDKAIIPPMNITQVGLVTNLNIEGIVAS